MSLEFLNPFEVGIILSLSLIFLWLVIVTIIFLKNLKFFNNLVKGTGGESLQQLLQDCLKRLDFTEQDIEKIFNTINKIEQKDLSHFQKIGFLRFNPFPETGSDLSFALALLDERNNGFVISSLHSREKTRIYAKPVKNGCEAGISFSEEEKKAIREAMNATKSKVKN